MDQAGLARLARRISAWTTRGLLSAIILVAGLGFGRQVLRWWSDEAAAPTQTAGLPGTVGAAGLAGPSRFEVGQKGWAVVQHIAAGSREEAAAALRAECRKLTSSAPLPADRPGPAEQRLLETLAQRRPVDESPDQWQLYELEGPAVLVAGTKSCAAPEAERNPGVAWTGRRVVTWGIAVPQPDRGWTLYAVHAGATSRALGDDGMELPLPAGSHKSMSIHVPGGPAVVRFAGNEPAEAWKEHFDSCFAGMGWPVGRWQREGPRWQCRAGGVTRDGLVSVEVQFASDDAGRLAGVLVVTPGGPAGSPLYPQPPLPRESKR
ncbi:MAG: hypothetical protein NUV77_18465 [Thermoguttaceae bacterium]|jgi:hypothetical protein|nr:hypothetical protein [Thermoguttaceae bacterium]